MKPCKDVLLYAQGDLSAAEKMAFEAHLKTCPSCQAELKFLAKLDESLTPPAAPQRVVDQLFARTTRKKSVWARLKWKWVSAAAAACACVFLVPFFSQPQAFSAQELVAYMDSGRSDMNDLEMALESIDEDMSDLEAYF